MWVIKWINYSGFYRLLLLCSLSVFPVTLLWLLDWNVPSCWRHAPRVFVAWAIETHRGWNVMVSSFKFGVGRGCYKLRRYAVLWTLVISLHWRACPQHMLCRHRRTTPDKLFHAATINTRPIRLPNNFDHDKQLIFIIYNVNNNNSNTVLLLKVPMCMRLLVLFS